MSENYTPATMANKIAAFANGNNLDRGKITGKEGSASLIND